MTPSVRNPRLVGAGFCNVESPVLGPGGWILNVCSLSRPSEPWFTKGGDITITHPDHPLESRVLFSTSTSNVDGIPAALAFGPDQAIYIADEGRRAIVRVDPSGAIEDFISHYKGERINGPNDLSFASSGDLYFTDPWTSSPKNPVASVFHYEWATGELSQLDGGMQFTNGIVVRGDRLFVAETFPRRVWMYILSEAGLVERRHLFCELPDIRNPPMLPTAVRETLGVDYVVGPDGMALDREMNLWVTHYGGSAVLVYSPTGELTAMLPTPGAKPTNACFGGAEFDRLYVTIDDPGIIVEYSLGVAGDRLSFCPSAIESHAWEAVIRDRNTKFPGERPLPPVEPPAVVLSTD